MTDEEKAERKWNEIAYKYTRIEDMACRIIKDDFIKAYLDGLAEGRKEVTYMKAEEYDKYLDACRKNIELEKENAEAKELIKTLLLIADNKVSQMEFQLCVADAKQFLKECRE